MAKPKTRVDVEGKAPLRQGLPDLAALRDRLPPGREAPREEAKPASPATLYERSSRVVVRRERKGHGGKTATRIEGLAGSAAELGAAMSELKRALGCGASIDGEHILVQGAQGERVAAFLEARGVKRVVIGS